MVDEQVPDILGMEVGRRDYWTLRRDQAITLFRREKSRELADIYIKLQPLFIARKLGFRLPT